MVTKPRIQAGGATMEKAQAVLVWVMRGMLKLLHPFMPYITEEILAALSLRAHAISMPFAAVWLVTGMYYQALGAYSAEVWRRRHAGDAAHRCGGRNPFVVDRTVPYGYLYVIYETTFASDEYSV